MGTNHRSRQANNADEVLGQAWDRRSRTVVTIDGAATPDYAKAADGNPGGGIVRSITGNEADPNVTPPTPATLARTAEFGSVAFHVVLPAAGACDVEVWVDGGRDAAGNAVGWLLVDTITTVVSRREYLRAVGQRSCFLRVVNTANINGGSPATLRATGVA